MATTASSHHVSSLIAGLDDSIARKVLARLELLNYTSEQSLAAALEQRYLMRLVGTLWWNAENQEPTSIT